MDKRTEILAAADIAFDTGGFRGIGIDAVLAPTGASTRTLYKHFGSRDGLVLAVLEDRHRRFSEALEAVPDPGDDPIALLFDTLRHWHAKHGARGCLLLRARAEYAAANAAVVDLVRRQKEEFRRMVAERVAASLGRAEERLATQVWLLFEGATAAASVAGPAVVDAARDAALSLVAAARGQDVKGQGVKGQSVESQGG